MLLSTLPKLPEYLPWRQTLGNHIKCLATSDLIVRLTWAAQDESLLRGPSRHLTCPSLFSSMAERSHGRLLTTTSLHRCSYLWNYSMSPWTDLTDREDIWGPIQPTGFEKKFQLVLEYLTALIWRRTLAQGTKLLRMSFAVSPLGE